LRGEDIFKLTNGNKILHQDSNSNGIRVVNFQHQKMQLLRAQYSHTKTLINTPVPLLMGRHNHINHILTDRIWHSNILNVRSCRGADCDTDHYQVVAKVREGLGVSQHKTQKFNAERFNFKKVREVDVKK